MPDHAAVFREIEKLVSSHTLHGSESLCKLLRYLAHHALEKPGTPLKEYQIATELFGRQADFDPQLDSMVRVQAGRLRSKLAEYYGSEGTEDPIWVELPKGAYVLAFHPRVMGVGVENSLQTASREPERTGPVTGKFLLALISLSILLAGAIAAILILLGARQETVPPITAEPPAAFQIFWKPFITGSEAPWVVFSNAAFVGRPETGMRYFDAARDAGTPVWDHYTGVGEVLAIHNLGQMFYQLHRNIRVKRGSLFSLDDVKNNDLIFVGSPSENLTLSEISSSKEFVFQRLDSGPRKGDLAIVNVHPQANEANEYLASRGTLPLTEDFAVITLVPGLSPARSIMILAGTTTFGTQGAVEFVCRQTSVEELLSRLSVSHPGELKPFEALVRVKVTRGVPFETELVAVRKRGQH